MTAAIPSHYPALQFGTSGPHRSRPSPSALTTRQGSPPSAFSHKGSPWGHPEPIRIGRPPPRASVEICDHFFEGSEKVSVSNGLGGDEEVAEQVSDDFKKHDDHRLQFRGQKCK